MENHEDRINAAFREAAEARRRMADWVAARSTIRPHTSHPGLSLVEAPGIPGFVQLEEIQRGGQGVVYRAVQSSTGRCVAIKLMRGGALASPADHARFDREVRILALLKHPNIVPIYDSGQAGGWNYFVMDYIAGAPLDEFVVSRALSGPAVVELTARVCEAVDAAHVRGIIHRDLKPANVRVDAQGEPHVLDFGLAKQPDIDNETLEQTKTGQFVGSLPWASPEQVSGGAAHVDMRSDVYSIGVMLYRLLTGEHPYPLEGGVRKLIERIEQSPPIPPSTRNTAIDDELEAIILKCLAKEPKRRYQSAGELARELRNYLAGETISAKRDSSWYVLRKQLERHRGPLLVALGFVLLVVVSAVVAWSLYLSSRARLWDSLVAQARAGRFSERIGRRTDGLAALAAARDIRFSHELRNEAAACLALTDLRLVRSYSGLPAAWAIGLRNVDRFAIVADDGTIEVRTVFDGSTLVRLESPGGRANRLIFSPDGRWLAARHEQRDATILSIWDVRDRQLRFRLREIPGTATSHCTFSPVRAEFAIIEPDRSVGIYALDSGERLNRIQPGFAVHELSYDFDGGRLLFLSYAARRVAIWDIASACTVREFSLSSEPLSIAWSRDGSRIAVGCSDHMIRVFDVSSGREPRELRGHNGQVVMLAFAAQPDRLVSWGWDSQTRFWDLTTGRESVHPLIGGRLSGAGDRMAHWHDGTLRIWEFVEAKVAREIDLGEPKTARIGQFVSKGESFIVTRSGGAVLCSAADGWPLRTVNAPELRCLAAAQTSDFLYGVVEGKVVRWPAAVTRDVLGIDDLETIALPARAHDIGFSPDGSKLIVVGPDQFAVYDTDRFQPLFHRAVWPGGVQPRVTADGRWVFVGNWKGVQHQAMLVDLVSGEAWYFPGEHVVGCFDPAGMRFAVSTSEYIEVWDLRKPEPIYRLRREPGQTTAGPLAFTPDGRLLAVAHSSYDVQIVDSAAGKPIVRLPNPRATFVGDLDFSPDGRFLLIVGPSRYQYVWDLQELRRELREMRLDWNGESH